MDQRVASFLLIILSAVFAEKESKVRRYTRRGARSKLKLELSPWYCAAIYREVTQYVRYSFADFYDYQMRREGRVISRGKQLSIVIARAIVIGFSRSHKETSVSRDRAENEICSKSPPKKSQDQSVTSFNKMSLRAFIFFFFFRISPENSAVK